MPKAINTPTTPTPMARRRLQPAAGRVTDRRDDGDVLGATALGERFVRYQVPMAVTLHPPGEPAGSPPRIIVGQAFGEMHMRGALHHYRVLGDDNFVYLVPPNWLTIGHAVAASEPDRRCGASAFDFDFRFLERAAIVQLGVSAAEPFVYAYPPPDGRDCRMPGTRAGLASNPPNPPCCEQGCAI